MPVEYDSNPLSSRPWITWILSAALIAITLLTLLDPVRAVENFGLYPANPGRAFGLTFLTSFFIHAGWLHLLGNVYFLVIFGDNVEDFLGRARFATLLVLATLIGGLLHVLGDPRADIPVVGASGGISGVITFYALKYPRLRLGFFLHVFRIPIPWWIRLPAWTALLIWGAMQLFLALEQVAGVSRISALAHIGGALVGLTLWLAWDET